MVDVVKIMLVNQTELGQGLSLAKSTNMPCTYYSNAFFGEDTLQLKVDVVKIMIFSQTEHFIFLVQIKNAPQYI